ncbi:MAG: bifunctional DNA-formamidopyrimidine glycosylase/DNA-(apurinic or apyrimidinic site) lyase [Sandaracinaceae bacterium]|nr:bifunctional DNA-formamidopyrimidine glycosylase/DNA-(apurinic or apyrimidinic site) lyase [Sandaracinaceae bacterium]
MPELPEVEHARRLVARVAEGRRIARVRCARDPRVIPAGAAKVQRALAGARVEHARRHGKWLWLELDRAPHPLFHFGMTGGFHTRGAEALPLKTAPKPRGAGWPPPHAKLELVLDDGRELAFVNVRRFGRVLLRDRPEEEPPISELGFDPLEAMPSPARFAALLGARRGTLKGLLLDQSFAAGVGNWIADEVLYQARLDPRRAVGSLSPAEVRRLREAIRRVVRTAVDLDADADRYPRSWLFHHRWEKDTRTARGERVLHATIAGRTTAWVPSRQR